MLMDEEVEDGETSAPDLINVVDSGGSVLMKSVAISVMVLISVV